MRLGYDAGLLIVGALIALTISEAFPKTFDERKWEAIQRNREIRIATERRYEACMAQCRKACN